MCIGSGGRKVGREGVVERRRKRKVLMNESLVRREVGRCRGQGSCQDGRCVLG